MGTINQANTKAKKLQKPNNIVVIPTDLQKDFFKWWCICLHPFVSLTNKEIDVVASFLKQRWELSKCILDPTILDTALMSEDTRRKVIEECGITMQHFYVVMSSLRKKKVIIDNTLNPRLIPNLRQNDNGCFQFLILFKDKDK